MECQECHQECQEWAKNMEIIQEGHLWQIWQMYMEAHLIKVVSIKNTVT